MRRNQYRAVITVLSIVNIVLLAACVFLIYRVIVLEDSISNAAEAIATSVTETDSDTENAAGISTDITAEEQAALDAQQVVAFADTTSYYAEFVGTWIDGDNTLTILDDGSYMWIRNFDGVIRMCEQGYLSDAYNMIILRKYEMPGNLDADRYYSISEIPDSEWDDEKEVGYTVYLTSSETMSMRNVRGETLGYSFFRE